MQIKESRLLTLYRANKNNQRLGLKVDYLIVSTTLFAQSVFGRPCIIFDAESIDLFFFSNLTIQSKKAWMYLRRWPW